MVNVNNQNLILLLCLGKNSNKPNNIVFKPIKLLPISGAAPPYSFKMVLKKSTYMNNDNKIPKIIYP